MNCKNIRIVSNEILGRRIKCRYERHLGGVLARSQRKELTTGFVVTRRQLLAKVWWPSHLDHDHYLRIYMGQLRHKIEADPTRPR